MFSNEITNSFLDIGANQVRVPQTQNYKNILHMTDTFSVKMYF